MKPHSAVFTRNNYTIVHKCLKCGERKQVKAAPSDNRDMLVSLLKPGPLII
jgi:hypothetical protein